MAELTDAAIDRALARGRAASRREPRAGSARFDAASRRVIVELTNGCTFAFPADLAQGLEGASDADLADIEILGNGYGLHWPNLDVDLAVPDLMAGLLGTRSWMARKSGSTTSKAKAQAARENGKKGGRPRQAARGKNVKEGGVPLSRTHLTKGGIMNLTIPCDSIVLGTGRMIIY